MKTKKPNHPYSVIVDWSDEDQTWIGRCPELMLGGVHGNDRDKVYEELCQAVDEHIALADRDQAPLPEPLAGRKFSGKFVVRMSPEQHRTLALRALQARDSLNNYVVQKLETTA